MFRLHYIPPPPPPPPPALRSYRFLPAKVGSSRDRQDPHVQVWQAPLISSPSSATDTVCYGGRGRNGGRLAALPRAVVN
jgi:hypothetical protein